MTMPPRGNRRIDRVLDPSFIDGIERNNLAKLREKRDECAEEESILSYERSLIHTRLKLLKAERERRESGAPARSLIDNLAQILSDENVTHRGAFPSLEAPPIADNPRRRVEKLVNDDTLSRLPDLTDAEIADATAKLEAAETEVSESRRAVHAVLDVLIEEIGRRKAGADV
jgi:anti-sigma-K factor RsiG